jgi:hypothetical protein
MKQTKQRKPAIKVSNEKKNKKQFEGKNVEIITEDVKYIKSFVALHNKKKTYKELRGLLSRLQKSIVQRLINKDSEFADEIRIIQKDLITLVKSAKKHKGKGLSITIKDELLNELTEIAQGERVYPSVRFIKRYIGMQGKKIVMDRAKQFVSQVEEAIKTGKISKNDPYLNKVKIALRSVQDFISKKNPVVTISSTELNGLTDIIEHHKYMASVGMEYVDTDNVKYTRPTGIMNSKDFLKLRFDRLGFTGKWLSFIGDPGRRFTAMVFGPPKFGKSFLCLDFARYLAKEHGRVLYVSKEEQLDSTLHVKFNALNIEHDNFFVSDTLEEDLTPYKFVFLDSISKLRLTPEDLERLKEENPKTSFIYIFQVTKNGKFRGRNDFQHDVDIIIELPEKGRAVQYGRYNQGGEMEIYFGDETENELMIGDRIEPRVQAA